VVQQVREGGQVVEMDRCSLREGRLRPREAGVGLWAAPPS